MAEKFTPLVYDEQKRVHRPAVSGNVLDPTFIPVSGAEDNAATMKDDGLFVPAAALSLEEDNYLRYGNDRGLYISAADILSNESMNVLGVSAVDHKLILSRDAIGVIVSKDDGNVLHTGLDGGALLRVTDLISGRPENALRQVQDDALLHVQVVSPDEANLLDIDAVNGNSALLKVEQIRSDDPKNLIAVHDDGRLVANVDSIVSPDAGNILQSDANGKLYVKEVLAGDLLSESAEMLFLDENGKLSAAIEMSYETVTGKFELRDRDGNTIGSVTVPSAVSALKRVELVRDPEGEPTGLYLKFTFLLDTGEYQDVYANVSALIDTYLGGDGITISNNTVSVLFAQGKGLDFYEGKLGVKIADLVHPETPAKPNALLMDEESGLLFVQPVREFHPKASDGIVVFGENEEYFAVRVKDHHGLTFDENGDLMVQMEDLRSEDEGNIIQQGTDGKLFVTTGGLAGDLASDLVDSSRVDNPLISKDGFIELLIERLISQDPTNMLTVGSDGKLMVDAAKWFGVSADAENLLENGSDGRPYLSQDWGTIV